VVLRQTWRSPQNDPGLGLHDGKEISDVQIAVELRSACSSTVRVPDWDLSASCCIRRRSPSSNPIDSRYSAVSGARSPRCPCMSRAQMAASRLGLRSCEPITARFSLPETGAISKKVLVLQIAIHRRSGNKFALFLYGLRPVVSLECKVVGVRLNRKRPGRCQRLAPE
jgi:hypothetical protein